MTRPAGVDIMPGRAADLEDILALLAESRLPPDGLEAHLAGTLVARDAGRIVGCAALERYGSVALLRSVAVHPSRRGEGLGQRLTAAALDKARRDGIRKIYLLTETAGDFFPRFGFRPIARDAVDAAVRESVEFTTTCPASALAMALEIP